MDSDGLMDMLSETENSDISGEFAVLVLQTQEPKSLPLQENFDAGCIWVTEKSLDCCTKPWISISIYLDDVQFTDPFFGFSKLIKWVIPNAYNFRTICGSKYY